MTNLTAQNFSEFISNSNKTVIVDFWAPWCGPCRAQTPVLEQLQSELSDSLVVGKVNVDDEPALAMAYGVESIPTIIVFKNGQAVNKAVGLRSLQQLKSML